MADMHTRIRVLVVENDERVSAQIKSLLTRARYDVVVVHSGAEAFAEILHGSFDVVVCSCLATLRGLKALAPTIPVVMVPSSPINEAALDQSSFDYLSATLEIDGAKLLEKPFNESDLMALIYGCVARRSIRVH
jgi:DNA-binding response OmpR family regulator